MPFSHSVPLHVKKNLSTPRKLNHFKYSNKATALWEKKQGWGVGDWLLLVSPSNPPTHLFFGNDSPLRISTSQATAPHTCHGFGKSNI